MNLMKPFYILFAIFTLGSCATPYAPFTEPMLTELKLDTKNIKNVQFYISDEIFLFKLESQQAVGKQDGAFIKTVGGLSEKISIKRHAPCIVERIDKDGIFHVRFEEGKDKVLKFKKADNNRYYLHTEIVNNRHQVSYGGETYYANSPSLISFIAVKMIDTKNATNARSIEGKRA